MELAEEVPIVMGQATSATATTGVTVQPTGAGVAHNTMQPSIVLNYLIKS